MRPGTAPHAPQPRPAIAAYRRHGLIFGARLAAKTTRLEITDTVFARNIRNYARKCVFHALLLGHISADDLRESTDKRIGVEKDDERRVAGVDYRTNEVLLDDRHGGTVGWKPEEIGGRRGGSEVYRAEEIDLRAGDRIRCTRNDAGLGLVNSCTAEVLRVANGRVTFRLEDGKTLELGDPQLSHLDHAWASTVHTFQGRTVDNVIAAMEARHPHLTTQKSFYVEISRARDRAELVTDDAGKLLASLQEATGERIAAL